MYTIVYKPGYTRIILLLLFIIAIQILIYYACKQYLLHETVVFIFITLLMIIFVVRAVGIFVMYPGSALIFKSEVENRQNQRLLRNIHNCMLSIQSVCQGILKANNQYTDYRLFSTTGINIQEMVRMQINLIQRSSNKDKDKTNLLDLYKKLVYLFGEQIKQSEIQMKQQFYSTTKFIDILKNPNIVLQFTNNKQMQSLKQICYKTKQTCRKIWALCMKISVLQVDAEMQDAQSSIQSEENNSLENKTNSIKAHRWKVANWHLFSQKLFTFQSFFSYWDAAYDYVRVKIPVDNGINIDCAIIHHQKQANHYSNEDNRQAVLFCNPNGAYIQNVALTSSYMSFYLKRKLKVVLWNYRGYGFSDGIATMQNCIKDVEIVYKYVQQKYNIKISVLHGYSIGGACAINLAYRFTKSFEKNPIKVLVADRCFSSIDLVAKNMLGQSNNRSTNYLKKLIVPLTRCLFPFESSNLAEKFVQINCQKIVIYDRYDEIIKNQSSLKYSLQQLYDLKTTNSLLMQKITENIQLFIQNLFKLFLMNRQIYTEILKILKNLDGAGVYIQQLVQATQNKQKHSQIKQLMRQYISGLIIYGPKLNLPLYREKRQISVYAMNKIAEKIKMIQLLLNQNIQARQIQLNKYIKSIQSALIFASQSINQQYQQKNQKIYGQLIVSEVGHNNQLRNEFYTLASLFNDIFQPKTK